MSSSSNMIWMNVTTSANWRRPPVGIVRVEESLRAELAKLYGERFRQCVWQGGRFIEWKPALDKHHSSTARNEAPISEPAEYPPEVPPIFPLLPRRQALIYVAQGVLSLLPSKIRPYFNRLLYTLRPVMARAVIRNWLPRRVALNSKSTRLASPTVFNHQSSEILFAPGDVLISVGLDWDYPYYKDFYYLRKEHDVKVVTCCYDLIPVLYPQYCVGEVAGLFTAYFLDIADGSDLVLCISKQSEQDLRKLLERTGAASPGTHVFPLGDNVPVAAAGNISAEIKDLFNAPFILFVSSIERRKNHEILYRAYHLLCAEGKRGKLPKLVFVGMPGWGVSDVMKDIELDPLTRGLIIQLNHVADDELRALYESALFCVFPSFYEGWGLPVGEALSFGKAVIASNQGSLPEVGGDLVCYADPWSPRAWAAEIYKMVEDEAWRRDWERKAKEQYQARSWEDAAMSVMEAIGRL